MDQQYRQLLEGAIQGLCDKDRVIIRLHLAGETEETIGKVFRITHQAISKQLRRIKTTLAAKCSGSMGIENDH